MTRSLSVVPSMLVGYQGCGFDSPVYKLSETCGDYLENITSGDKLALIAVLAGWLQEDDPTYTIDDAAHHCILDFSFNFDDYLEALTQESNYITPQDALNLIAALTAQLKGGVYA